VGRPREAAGLQLNDAARDRRDRLADREHGIVPGQLVGPMEVERDPLGAAAGV
jgi:hypothetical protein